jgi:3-oxoacyl-[acyl-carrier-protein] synthase-3
MSEKSHRLNGSRGVVIVGTGSGLPEKILSNKDLEKMVDTSDEWILTRTGIKERRIAADQETVSDMALTASQAALEMAGLSPLDIDVIIVATVTPDRMLPSSSCTLQEKLGATNAAAFDLNAACTGFLYALSVGASMVVAGTANTVLTIGAETLSKIVDYEDRSTCILFGDGAGAVILRPCEAGKGIHAVEIRSDGTQGELLEIPAGGSLHPTSHETVDQKGHFIKMKGNELFKFAVRSMESITRQTLEASNLTADDLAVLIPHQANYRIIRATAERLGVPMDRVVVNIENYGNTSAASVPISLDQSVRSGQLKQGDQFGMVAFGGGVTWGAAISEWNPALAEPIRGDTDQETKELPILSSFRKAR